MTYKIQLVLYFDVFCVFSCKSYSSHTNFTLSSHVTMKTIAIEIDYKMGNNSLKFVTVSWLIKL